MMQKMIDFKKILEDIQDKGVITDKDIYINYLEMKYKELFEYANNRLDI